MELGRVEISQIEFSFEKFKAIVKISLEEGSTYWARFKTQEVPFDLQEKYRGMDFPHLIARAIWYDSHAVRVYSRRNINLLLGEISMPTVRAALAKMSAEYNEYFQYLMQEHSEPVDCDVFLQLATMGELRFG